MPSDLEQLVDMGFDKTRAEMAVKKSGGRTLLTLTDGVGTDNA
jgi:hypothetical protein